jgi:DNA-binding response OmpR family regulator
VLVASPKLLIVEDDPANLELMTELLKQHNVKVRPESDSQTASRLIQQEKFDGIFLDLTMPVVSGFELAKLVRESVFNRTTPIVIVTGREEKDTMHLSFSLGATFFLQKPIDIQKIAPLLQKIREPSPENRRRLTRVPLNTNVACTIADATLNGMTWNVSQGGIQLEVARLELGDLVRMSFVLPRPVTIIKAEGLVVWAQEGRQGLYFTEMLVEYQEALRAYILRG